MAKTFNGLLDLITATPAVSGTVALVIPDALNSGFRYSHPCPFVLASGKLILGYCANDDPAGANFVFRCKTSTNVDGSGSDPAFPSGTGVLIGGAGNNGSDTFHGGFAQLSGGNVVCFYGLGASVRYRISTDDGATWGAETTLTSSTVQDPHPCCILVGTTLTVIYGNNGIIKAKQSTVTSSTLGAFGSEFSVATVGGQTLVDPSVCLTPSAPSGSTTRELIVGMCSATDNSIRMARSNDNGVGASWGSVTVLVATASNPNAEGAMFPDGNILWLTYSSGSANSGATQGTPPRNVRTQSSPDNGTTWGQNGRLYGGVQSGTGASGGDDTHRCHFVTWNNAPLGYATNHAGDTDYHVSKLNPTTQAIQNVRFLGKPQPVNDTTVVTFLGWVKLTSPLTANVANNMFIFGRAGVQRVLQVKNLNTTTGVAELHVFISYSTTNLDYWVPITFPAATWVFIAAVWDSALGAGQRCYFFTGTTVPGLAAISQGSVTVVAEPVGTLVTDEGSNITIGGRSTDALRTFKGDLGGVGFIGRALTLDELRIAMCGVPPAPATGGVWTLAASDVGSSPDISGNANTGVYGGGTYTSPAAGGTPPAFLAPVYRGVVIAGRTTGVKSGIQSGGRM